MSLRVNFCRSFKIRLRVIKRFAGRSRFPGKALLIALVIPVLFTIIQRRRWGLGSVRYGVIKAAHPETRAAAFVDDDENVAFTTANGIAHAH